MLGRTDDRWEWLKTFNNEYKCQFHQPMLIVPIFFSSKSILLLGLLSLCPWSSGMNFYASNIFVNSHYKELFFMSDLSLFCTWSRRAHDHLCRPSHPEATSRAIALPRYMGLRPRALLSYECLVHPRSPMGLGGVIPKPCDLILEYMDSILVILRFIGVW